MKVIKEFIVPTVILFAICFVAALLLGLTNDVTAPKIAENAAKAQQEAMAFVLPMRQSLMKKPPKTKTEFITPLMIRTAMLSAMP